jgi:hypothetical protein
MSVGVGITNPLTSSGPTVTAPGTLPTSTNTVWSTPMRDLGAHIRCSSITTLQDSHIEGQLHQSKHVITTAIAGSGAGSPPTTIPAANIYGGIVYLNAGSSTNNYQFDTVANILAAFPSMHNNDFVDLYIFNQGTNMANIHAAASGESFSFQGYLTIAPDNLAHIIMNVQNVTAINGVSPNIVFIGSAQFLYSNSPPALVNAGISGGSTFGTPSTITGTEGAIITAENLVSQFVEITGSPTAGFNLITDSAMNIIAAIPNVQVNNRFTCRVWNQSGETATISSGGSVTLTPASPTIATGDYADFVIVITDTESGEQAVTIYVM